MGRRHLYTVKFRCPNTRALVYFPGTEAHLTPWDVGFPSEKVKIRYRATGFKDKYFTINVVKDMIVNEEMEPQGSPQETKPDPKQQEFNVSFRSNVNGVKVIVMDDELGITPLNVKRKGGPWNTYGMLRGYNDFHKLFYVEIGRAHV